MSLLTVVVLVLMAGGIFFGIVTAVGLLRLPDLYSRAHAASKSDTLGAVLTLGAVALVFGPSVPTIKTGLLLVFLFVTSPTAAHAITRAAYDQGIAPWQVDEEGSEQ